MTVDTSPPPTTLLDLADVRLQTLLERHEAASTTLDALLERLFNPADHSKLTVSAFGSSL